MARQVLENGVILPAEYSDDWYDDMTSNLTKLDDVIGSDSEKLSSSDVGAAALSNNYNDLDNLPTIPTVNDATLTIQKNGVDVQTFTANASSNVTCNITVPTKTSDLTNDSNFVDTSNSAVASGITSAKVTSYDSHIADTDIHVTTADKNRWNNGVSQSYVFRYSSTALVASSTNANSLLDNTDNLKVGDKVIDSSGVLFSITAIDTQNSTFTIGTALVDLAQDSDVVHKSGDESIGGKKTFRDDLTIYNYDSSQNTKNLNIGSSKIQVGDTSNSDAFGIRFNAGASFVAQILAVNDTTGTQNLQLGIRTKDGSDNFITSMVRSRLSANGNSSFEPGTNDSISLGSSSFKWKSVYATNYYYGSNNVEFSTKFVTTDTAQTIDGLKTFPKGLRIYNTNTSDNTSAITLRTSKVSRGSTTDGGDSLSVMFNDRGDSLLSSVRCTKVSNGTTQLRNIVNTTDTSDNIITCETQLNIAKNGDKSFIPSEDSQINLGSSSYRWKSFNGVEPSSLSLPSGNLNDIIDISSYLVNLDGTANTYTAPANGWISITMSNSSGIQAYINGLWGHQIVRPSTGSVRFLMPILKDKTANILIFGGTIDNARFIPCQGNV